MGMFGPKCPNCWERFENCTCCTHISRCPKCFFPLNACVCKNEPNELAVLPLGRITPIKGYKTTDGRVFTGKDAQENAEDHQRWLDRQDTVLRKEPRKTSLKKRKHRKGKRG
jgi:hypothetical protein